MGTYCKKAIFSLCFLALLSIVVSPAIAAEIPSQSQGTEATGILPSNPFYFFKEWGRSIRRTLSFTDLKKAETQLGVVAEQIAEIEKLNELQVAKREAFERAVGNYSANIDLLKTYATTLHSSRGNAAVEKLLGAIVTRGANHYIALQGLLGKFDGKEYAYAFDRTVNEAIDHLVGLLASLPNVPSALRAAPDEQGDHARELFVALLAERLIRVASQDVAYELMKLQQTMIQKWTGQPEFIERIGEARDSEALLQVVDIAREKVFDNDLKNALNVVRQAMLEQMREQGVIDRALVTRAINNAKNIVSDASRKVGVSGELALIVRGLLDRARFQITAAESFLEDGSLGNAYGQIIGAVTAARGAAVLATTTAADYTLELEYMRQYFDAAMERVRASGIDEKLAPILFSKIGEAEVQIAKFGDLIAKNASVAKIVAAMRVAESMLGNIDQLIKELAK